MSALRELQKQVERLQAQLEELRAQITAKPTSQPWWEQIAGSAEGRPLFSAVARAGRKIRQADRAFAPRLKRGRHTHIRTS